MLCYWRNEIVCLTATFLAARGRVFARRAVDAIGALVWAAQVAIPFHKQMNVCWQGEVEELARARKLSP